MFYADFGEVFDFSSLESTGENNPEKGIYYIFSEVVEPYDFDLDKPIDTRMAERLINNPVSPYASYRKNSVTATFEFTGIDAESISVKLRRGDVPNMSAAEEVVSEMGLAIVDMYPELGSIKADTTYYLIVGELTGPEVTITLEENGGNELEDITKVVGSLLGVLPTPEREGYTFLGWYADEALTEEFAIRKVPEGGATAYAAWEANSYTLTFHVNGGNELEEALATKTLTFDAPYGELPIPEKYAAGFVGWFTEIEEGEEVTAETIHKVGGDVTVYARWKPLKAIPTSIFKFGKAEEYTYNKLAQLPEYEFNPEEGATYTESEFTFKYLLEGYENLGYMDAPVDAGTYTVIITRPEDNVYSKTELSYTGVVVIGKAHRTITAPIVVGVEKQGQYSLALKVLDASMVDDISPRATVIYHLTDSDGITYTSKYGNTVSGLRAETSYSTSATIIDPNYYDATTPLGNTVSTKATPQGCWIDEGNYDISWYEADPDAESYYLDSAAQVAGIAYLIDQDKTFQLARKNVYVTADLDFSEHYWWPIAHERMGESGYMQYRAFSASLFDGGNHVFSGITISPEAYIISFFAEPATTTRNIIIKDSRFTDELYEGSENVGYIGSISSGLSMGKIIGCVNYGDVVSVGKTVWIGGIVGRMAMGYATVSDGTGLHDEVYTPEVIDCVNYGNVAYIDGGGALGGITSEALGGRFINCVNFGDIRGGNSNSGSIGGIAGALDDGLVVNYGYHPVVFYGCYNAGTVSFPDGGASKNNRAGQFVGLDDGYLDAPDVTYENCYYLNGQFPAFNKMRGTDSFTYKPKPASSDGLFGVDSFDKVLPDSAGEHAGKKLLYALNDDVRSYGAETYGASEWMLDEYGYPVPVGSVQ